MELFEVVITWLVSIIFGKYLSAETYVIIYIAKRTTEKMFLLYMILYSKTGHTYLFY